MPLAEFPWKKYSFKRQPREYAFEILDYIYQGNIESNFNVLSNEKREWYHAPWMHYGVLGREFVNGFTREKSVRPYQLHIKQTHKFQNWAIPIVNKVGAYTYGQVWKDPKNPDVTKGIFNEGTVSAKLIFTEAPAEQVPFLKNSIEWLAFANESKKGTRKVFKTLRLLQIDFMVRDNRSQKTGWVMGTFMYNGHLRKQSSWYNLDLVGITWGNDPTYSIEDYSSGKKLKEAWINPNIDKKFLGYLGRLNGPVDNKRSSCMSCHGTSQFVGSSPNIPIKDMNSKEVSYWFRNLSHGEAFDKGAYSFDYSKQLSHGIMNFFEAKTINDDIGCRTFNIAK